MPDFIHVMDLAQGQALALESLLQTKGLLSLKLGTGVDGRLSHERIGFKTQRTLDDMRAESWRWQSNNPNGYDT